MKKNKFLVEYCYNQLGRPYWYGTFGQISSAQLLREKRAQYPARYTASDYDKQFGKRVHDCVGLIKGAMWSETFDSKPKYDPSNDVSANQMISLCTEKGPIEKIPEMPGLIVWKSGHVGVYVGNKTVIEARGHAWGVMQTRIDERPWELFGYCPYFEYETLSDFVTRLYHEILDREPDKTGLDFWVTQLKNGTMSPSKIILEFYMSPEFQNRNMSDSEFINILYSVFFDRVPDKQGFKFWLDFIPEHGRAATVLEFEKSEEWKRDEAVLTKTKI